MQPKNIIYPTDARLLNTARKALVRAAKQECIPLRQSYTRLGGKAYSSFVRENHRKDKKKSRKLKRKLKTYLGRVIRDIDRRCPEPSENMKYILGIARKLWQQKPGSKNKASSAEFVGPFRGGQVPKRMKQRYFLHFWTPKTI